jgi:hypothetical protein
MHMTGIAELLASIVPRLVDGGAADEALATLREPRGFGPFKTAVSFVPVGRAWRLGVLLLDREGRLFATGELTRAIEPGRAAVNRSALGERRRALRMAAAHGPFPPGEAVNFGYRPLAIDDAALASGSDIVFLGDSGPVLRLGAPGDPAGVTPLDGYLADRVELLLHPA